jgi:ribose-phosphate pyrophosphokinase
MIKLYSNFGAVAFQQMMFPSAENHVRIENEKEIRVSDVVRFVFQYQQDSELVQLMMLVDAVRRLNNNVKLHLNIDYFPGSRQDRVCYAGEALSVKVYADIINSLNFDKVYVVDPHSDVVGALVKNIHIISNTGFVESVLHLVLKEKRNATIISPDAGANKKIFNLCKQLNHLDLTVVRADKKRDTKDGKILGTEVFVDDLQGEDCFIVDDIVSYGNTFMRLAEVLKQKGAGNIYLIVSHHEGVANVQKLRDSGITKIFVHNFMGVYKQYCDTERDRGFTVIL